ncbi:uncharacterized protein TRIREDRAFT_108155 [Trichoderma reesei QM6a]|uniref:Predicted protein n=2 Tax=Hypocrea jecorina TaxID=51453 RepID=G0RLP5_HYPJQ|nr:uncharacterized protein TRIREDRAFT_108155 [Trichoderma reesei QM6a]EGR47913.1 predicted protein [Trichoderma reesei QM6a]ETS02069.1 hypothetical protein M419DRAFT_79174 [Trichoderma reesei RUT C-30]
MPACDPGGRGHRYGTVECIEQRELMRDGGGELADLAILLTLHPRKHTHTDRWMHPGPRAMALSQSHHPLSSRAPTCLLHPSIVSSDTSRPSTASGSGPQRPDSDAIPKPSSRPFKQRRHSDALAMGVSSCPIAAQCLSAGKVAHQVDADETITNSCKRFDNQLIAQGVTGATWRHGS